MKITSAQLRIESVNAEGWGVARPEGKEFWILNALPGELVEADLFRKRKGVHYGRARQILEPSPQRVEPREEHFTASSPWQIMRQEYENEIKQNLIREAFLDFGCTLPDFEMISPSADNSWHYRNKVEFSFYADEDDKLHFAFFARGGGSAKFILPEGSSLVPDRVNQVALKILDYLNRRGIQARQLKTLLLRYSFAQGKILASIFFKDESLEWELSELNKLLNNCLAGLRLIYSTPKSPASVITEIRLNLGETALTERINHLDLTFPADAFFQINPPQFQVCMQDMRGWVGQNLARSKTMELTDLYAGVGTIGLGLADMFGFVHASELFSQAEEFASLNASQNGIGNFTMRVLAAEDSLQEIQSDRVLSVDPPRAGLHPKVVARILEAKPPIILYLSCNYQTQARDVAQLKDLYEIRMARAYNFYPHTPHVESLIILELKS